MVLLLSGLGLLVVASLVILAMPREGPGGAADDLRAVVPRVRIVGDRACRECHPTEGRLHRRSGHSRTLRLASEVDADLLRWLDGRGVADPELPGVRWNYALRDGRLGVDRIEGDRHERMDFDYALGSGRHATTFVALTGRSDPSPGSREHRLTWFARGPSLGLTPGQEAAGHAPGMNPLGRDRGPGETIHCFGCHATTVSDSSPRLLDPGTLRPNVGCERCHGPGGAHVDAARRASPDLAMPFGKVWSAEGQMKLCGDCHRHPSQAPPGEVRPDNPTIARFQPVGLMQSRCFAESDGRLSCSNCHDPHDRASDDRAAYEAACLECHSPGGRSSCRVSPRMGCVGCHMPAVDAGQGVLFTDHWIRIRKGG